MRSPNFLHIFLFILISICSPEDGCSQAKTALPVSQDVSGTLIYANDSSGNRLPDYSYCGYKASEEEIPLVAARVLVPAVEGDATSLIQAAIDRVAELSPNEEGFRGAVLFEPAEYTLSGRLKISSSGIVLRGQCNGNDKTTMIAAGVDRMTLIRAMGEDGRQFLSPLRIKDPYVPVGATSLSIESTEGFKKGDHIRIKRFANQRWIDVLGMNAFGGQTEYLGWNPDERIIEWERTIQEINGNELVFEVPLTNAIESEYGGGEVQKMEYPGRVSHIGIENLKLVSAYDTTNEKDEDHCWNAISFEHAENAWVRQVEFKSFAGSAVAVYRSARKITVEDCISLAPVSEIGGQRRYTYFLEGQQCLFQRCYAEYGYHDFAVGFCVAGPNAFVQCESHLANNFSGTLDSWSNGVLFDLVDIDGNGLRLKNRMVRNQGAGWTAANCMLWQCKAAQIDCYKPPTAQNYAFGTWAQFSGDAYWYEPNSHINPRSLFYAQLEQRTGKSKAAANLLPVEIFNVTSPDMETAARMTELTTHPPLRLKDLIRQRVDSVSYNNLISGIPVQEIPQPITTPETRSNDTGLKLMNGRLMMGAELLTGSRHVPRYWRGQIRPYYLEMEECKPHLSRFVPGRYGEGLTDDPAKVADWMENNHICVFEHNYGLWYDRRRDDHEWIRRMNGDAWAPFLEQPFARSGKGTAWDGLSKYDLTDYNPFYWNRLKHFAELAVEKDLVLFHYGYLQHNILEAAAHFSDFPWRTANNINNTGFPDPPFYAGDKRIFIDTLFYDTTHLVRKDLHKAYIHKCLNSFAQNPNVIHFLSREFTGPLHFMEFWLDAIGEWKRTHSLFSPVALSATRDVQDSILADPSRASLVDVIDIKYWHYRDDGSLYAPPGGRHMSPRQHARKIPVGSVSFNAVYRAVKEYRERFPQKAVIYSGPDYQQYPWASLMAGGSLAPLPEIRAEGFLTHAAEMQPLQDNENPAHFSLVNESGKIIYLPDANGQLKVNLSGSITMLLIDPADGAVIVEKTVEGPEVISFENEVSKPIVIWLKKNQ